MHLMWRKYKVLKLRCNTPKSSDAVTEPMALLPIKGNMSFPSRVSTLSLWLSIHESLFFENHSRIFEAVLVMLFLSLLPILIKAVFR